MCDVQDPPPAAGSSEVNTLPAPSNATHNEVDGHERPRSALELSTSATFQAPDPAVGSVDVTTWPALSTATHRPTAGQAKLTGGVMA